MQPTAGRSDASLHFVKMHPLQSMLALAAVADLGLVRRMNTIEAWSILQWAALVLQAAVLVLAIRLYLIKRTQAFALLMARDS